MDLSRRSILFTMGAVITGVQNEATSATKSNYFLYVGVYGKGVYGYRFDAAGAKLDPLGVVGELHKPSFLAIDPHNRFLYAVAELEHGPGQVGSFTIDSKTGVLTKLNAVSTHGSAPCHLAVDKTARMVVTANYGTGTVTSHKIQHDGSLSEAVSVMEAHGSSLDPKRQKGPHAHETVISADNKFLYVPDLGLDQIRIYKLDPAAGSLTPSEPAFASLDPGMGPRHMAFDPKGSFDYVVCELKSFVTAFSHDKATGALTKLQSYSTLPPDATGDNAPAEIITDHAGKFVYSTNRGNNSIAVFSVEGGGVLKQVQVAPAQGNFPRGFMLDPTGQYAFVGNQNSNDFAILHVDKASGKLTPSGQVIKDAPAPVAFEFVPSH